MNLRRFLAEAGTLAGLAVACALVSNALADRQRRLALRGDYPNATRVTARAAAPAAPAPAPSAALPEPDGPAAVAPPGATVPPGTAPAPAAPTAPQAAGAAKGEGAPAAPSAAAPKADPSAELLARFPPHGQPYAEIGGEEAAWLHGRGALVLDARRTKDYAQGHVAGARSFPIWESEQVKERVENLVAEGRDGRLPVVLYCSGGDCEDSHMLAQMLFGAGFENLLVYRDGFPDWLRRGGAVAAGGAP